MASTTRPALNLLDESRPMWKTLAVFLVPLMLSNIMQSASQTFGSIFLGRLIGVDALAAVSAVFPVFFVLFSFLIGVGSGSTVLIGQAYGAKDLHKVKKIAGTVIGAALAMGILAAVLGEIFAPAMLAALGTPAKILHDSDNYSRVLFLSAPIFFPYLIYTTVMRGVGDAKTPFYALAFSTILSIGLSPAFILGWFGLPRLGVVSVAVSSIIAQSVALAGLLLILRRRDDPLQLDGEMLRDFIVDWRIFWTVLRIGIPTGIQVVLFALAEVAVISFVNRFGPSATAAYGAVNQIAGYVQFPAVSLGIAASIFGAQCIGARREDRLREVVRSAVVLNYAIVGALAALCYLFSREILAWFITDVKTLDIANGLLMITLWSYTFFGNSSVISGVMRSSGDVLVPMFNGIAAIWLVEVPAAYVLMQHFGIDGIWMGYALSFCVVLLLQFCYFEFFWKRRTHERLA
ncbi:MAG TPA: MATE family efflux transporter [Candidatus Dormibacteraeota bacterium]|nr:MATE family efflux transporter [Candidatus Dormibacteraeota bacterium]